MDQIHYEASQRDKPDLKDALMAVDGITSVRGAATSDLYGMEEKADTDRKEITNCLNTVTCRIM